MKKILLVSATQFEIAGVIKYLEAQGKKQGFFNYNYNANTYSPLVTGVGSMKTALAVSRYCQNNHFDFAFNLGIAGAHKNKSLKLGEVVQVQSDQMADLGVELADGEFQDVFDLELEKKDQFPFKNGVINNDPIPGSNLTPVNGITVNTSSGTEKTITIRQKKYDFDIETMEGCAFFYASKILDMKAYQIRAISNYIEPRNRNNWQIEGALENLTKACISIIESGFDHYPIKTSSLS